MDRISPVNKRKNMMFRKKKIGRDFKFVTFNDAVFCKRIHMKQLMITKTLARMYGRRFA